MRILKTKKNFRGEFKRQMRYAIAAAVGFLIVFAWRDAIMTGARNLIEKFTETSNEIITAMFITVIGVVIILISSKLLKDK
jgi:Na+/H+ antiporter NhaC